MSRLTNLATRRVPRLVEETATPCSAAARSALEALDSERASVMADIDRLVATRDEVLLTGDDAAAERHDLALARARRTVERCDLRRPGLVMAVAEAKAREEAAAREKLRAEAEAAVNAVLARLDAEYDQPAATIAKFLADCEAADRLAADAGIPTTVSRLGIAIAVPGYVIEPARRETRRYYVDENGNPTPNPHPYTPDGLVDRRRYREERVEDVASPERRQPDTERHEGYPLLSLVKLPRASLNDRHADHWG